MISAVQFAIVLIASKQCESNYIHRTVYQAQGSVMCQVLLKRHFYSHSASISSRWNSNTLFPKCSGIRVLE